MKGLLQQVEDQPQAHLFGLNQDGAGDGWLRVSPSATGGSPPGACAGRLSHRPLSDALVVPVAAIAGRGGNLVVASPSNPESYRFLDLVSIQTPPARSSSPAVKRNRRPLSACRFVRLAGLARWLRRSGITALHGPLEPLSWREIVIDIFDLRGGSALEPRGHFLGKRRQCPAVRPDGPPAKRTTSPFLLVSQSPSFAS